MLERAENNPSVKHKSTVFNGVYVTRNVDQHHLYYLESLCNNDDASKDLYAKTKVK